MRTSLVLLFISFYSFGQNDFYNFYVNEDDATAVYRKVFESNNIKKKDFINYLNSLSNNWNDLEEGFCSYLIAKITFLK